MANLTWIPSPRREQSFIRTEPFKVSFNYWSTLVALRNLAYCWTIKFCFLRGFVVYLPKYLEWVVRSLGRCFGRNFDGEVQTGSPSRF